MSNRRFVALAFGAPLALALLHQGVGHPGDLGFFHGWYLAFREGGAFYRDGPGVNYPILGALLVCGPARVLDLALGEPLSLEAFVRVHKLTLALCEAAMVFAAADLARALGCGTWRRHGLFAYALPAVWLGGGYFGQTDALSTAALCVSAAGLLRFAKQGQGRDLARGLAGAHAAFLLKQLAWFSLPALAALLLAGLLQHGTARRWLATLASPLLWFVVDPLLTLPDGHSSHLAYLVARSFRDHGVLLTANGASLWSLAPPPLPSAQEPLVLGLDAAAIGLIAWLLCSAGAALHYARHGPRPRDFVRLAALGQLAMACLMTGVHERYLAHAVPLLFLVELGARPSRRALGVLVAALSAGPILASVHHSLGALGWPVPLALLSALWLAVAIRRPTAGPIEARALAQRLLLAGLSLAAALGAAELAVRALSLEPSRFTAPRALESADKQLAIDLYPDDPRGELPIDLRQPEALARWSQQLPAVAPYARRTPHGVALRFDAELCRLHPETEARGAGDRRVLVIGDSFTEGQGVAGEQTFSARLDLALEHTRVRNCGRRGYDFPTLRERFDALVETDAPHVVLYAMVLNDPERSEAFAARQRFVDDWILARREMVEGAPSGPPAWPPRFYQVLADRIEGWQVQRETTAWYRAMVGRGDNEAGWQRTLAHLEAMNRRVEGRLLVALWPLLVGLDADYPFESTHAAIGEALRARGIHFVDTLEVFRGAPPESLWVHPADRHPNAEAHASFAAHVQAPLRAMLSEAR